ncbi:sugar phosphate isomerase/epimerase family protein [Algibacter mikhailovii]|uniref:sugar phosphate isomerase/epimerase family protein n=1 Tax=Algibacter mikhailovii TaxID=425498 RepID=UPI00249548D6|nr:TIM barrel protein [Algibacter mikhailovii]
MNPITRREFTKKSVLAMGFLPFATFGHSLLKPKLDTKGLSVHLFSKHLQFLSPQDAAEKAAEIGFQGLDLTVRPKGHVLPEDVTQTLPRAIEDIKKGGSSCSMITTAITDASNKTDINIIKTAANQGIAYYRSNWFKYRDQHAMESDLAFYQQKIKALSLLNSQHGIVGCYQNHAGHSIGASIWEIKKILESANSKYFGTQYDIRHATVEGGLSWENGLKLIQSSIKTIVLKDFKWGQKNGVWHPVNVPIGEGMVDFKTYFTMLKAYNINVPVSLHLEYDLGGAEKGKSSISIDKKNVYKAMKKDLDTVQRLWEEA